jgi:hypothetical protein
MPQGPQFQLARESIRTMSADQVLFALGFMPILNTVAYLPEGYVPHPDTVNFGPAWSVRSDHHNLRFTFLFGHPEPQTIVVFTPDDWMQAVAKSRAATGNPIRREDLDDWALLEARRLRMLELSNGILTHHDTSPDAHTLEEHYQDALTLASKGMDLAKLVRIFSRVCFAAPDTAADPADVASNVSALPGSYRGEIDRLADEGVQDELRRMDTEDGGL